MLILGGWGGGVELVSVLFVRFFYLRFPDSFGFGGFCLRADLAPSGAVARTDGLGGNAYPNATAPQIYFQ